MEAYYHYLIEWKNLESLHILLPYDIYLDVPQDRINDSFLGTLSVGGVWHFFQVVLCKLPVHAPVSLTSWKSPLGEGCDSFNPRDPGLDPPQRFDH